MLPWERSGTGDYAFRRGTASRASSAMSVAFAPPQRLLQRAGDHDLPRRSERREVRVVLKLLGVVRHHPVCVCPKHQRLIRSAEEGSRMPCTQLGAVLAPVRDRARAKAVQRCEQVDRVRRPSSLPLYHCDGAVSASTQGSRLQVCSIDSKQRERQFEVLLSPNIGLRKEWVTRPRSTPTSPVTLPRG